MVLDLLGVVVAREVRARRAVLDVWGTLFHLRSGDGGGRNRFG